LESFLGDIYDDAYKKLENTLREIFGKGDMNLPTLKELWPKMLHTNDEQYLFYEVDDFTGHAGSPIRAV
jgi:hypothetical protein